MAAAVVVVAVVMSVVLGNAGAASCGTVLRVGGLALTVSLDAGRDIRNMPAAPQVGVGYPFDLLTHGGIHFVAEKPLIIEPSGPPSGWDNPIHAEP